MYVCASRGKEMLDFRNKFENAKMNNPIVERRETC